MMTYQSDTRYCIKTIEPPYTERYVRWCERTMGEIITHFLLDCAKLDAPGFDAGYRLYYVGASERFKRHYWFGRHI